MQIMDRKNHRTAALTAILAAALYGISSPISKLLLTEIPPTLMAALLYLGAGLGMLVLRIGKRMDRSNRMEAGIARKDLPFVLGMIVLDIGAPIFLMLGLKATTPANVALMNNFEIVATSLIAMIIFKEAVGNRMWIAIILITLSTIVLSLENPSELTLTAGSVYVLLACVCWGFENNCTRMLSLKDPLQIVTIKGIGSGLGAFLIAMLNQQYSSNVLYILMTMLLGFVAYGLSIFFYIKAQRSLGASRTSAYYAAAPFIGVILSWILFQERMTVRFLVAFAIMLVGTYFVITEVHVHKHLHEEVTHEHLHNHKDGHHDHVHDPVVSGSHSHIHMHSSVEHSHMHTPDMHHIHKHEEH